MKSLPKLLKIIVYGLVSLVILVLIWLCNIYDFKGEKILIPKNYKGNVLIFYADDDNSKTNKDNNGSIIYKIPPSGVLVVNFKDYIHRGTPLQNRKYYFYNEKENFLEEIKEESEYNYSTEDYILYIYGSLHVFMESTKNKNIYFEQFLVLPKSESKKDSIYDVAISIEKTMLQRKIIR